MKVLPYGTRVVTKRGKVGLPESYMSVTILSSIPKGSNGRQYKVQITYAKQLFSYGATVHERFIRPLEPEEMI